jgi:uncharacterized protein DUF4440
MSDDDDVLAAAGVRAAAWGAGDVRTLEQLLHPKFCWTSHTGDVLDRPTYLQSNVGGATRWHGRQLEDAHVTVVADAAIVRCTARDDVDAGNGRQTYRMPMTQTWVRVAGRWLCLAGHAGPRLS